jgi:thiol:disulfide interchange protein DsbD
MTISRFSPLSPAQSLPAASASAIAIAIAIAIGLSLIGLVALADPASAKPWWIRGVQSNESDFLPPDVAFHVMAVNEGTRLRVRWVIADGYYLYRQRMNIAAESPDLTLGAPTYPRGSVKNDAYFGSQETYRQQVEATVPYTRIDGGAHPMQIKVTYQGCADAGLCYPPITKVLFPTGAAADTARAADTVSPIAAAPRPWERIAILGGILAFLLAGVMLRKGRKLALPPAV